MDATRINRIAGNVLLFFSLTAFLPVLIAYIHPSPPQADEDTGAHIFQLSIAALAPTLLLFFATADWTQPWRSARCLLVPAVLVVLAFAGVYYGEHYYWAAHS